MIITDNKIAFTAEEAFDALYQANRLVWEQAIDAITESASESYAQIYGYERDSLPFVDGIHFDCQREVIYFETT